MNPPDDNPIIFHAFRPIDVDLEKMVALFDSLPRSTEDPETADVNNLDIYRNPEEGSILSLTHEEGRLGIVISGRPERFEHSQRQWLESRGIEVLKGDTYFDYLTLRDEQETGPYQRYPVTPAEAVTLLQAILVEWAGLPPDKPLFATTIGNPDEWPGLDPDDWLDNAWRIS